MFGSDHDPFDARQFHAHHGTKSTREERLKQVRAPFGVYGEKDWRGHLVAIVHDEENKLRRQAPVVAIMTMMMSESDAAEAKELVTAGREVLDRIKAAFPDIDFTVTKG